MKKIAVFILCLFFLPVEIFAAERSFQPLAVKAAMLVEMNTGKVLYQQNADKVIQPASLSKIMSLYLISEDIAEKKAGYSDIVTISANAVQTGGSKMLFEPGVQYEVLDLVKGMAIHSANDASVALAEHFGGNVEQFVMRMNAKAKALGMKHTHFVNPHGLPNRKQKTTARDIYMLSREYLRRFPNSQKIHSIERFTFNNQILTNRNDLLDKYPGANGLKTGYVGAAGFHLVATAIRGGTRLMAVVLGAKNPRIRSQQARKLLDYGFGRIGEKNTKNRIGG
ncbi:MAG: D-alanyl-D-alanine carboxypeptidase (penicillin-binding protein 5/6) [Syntrophaceae bacterium]|nr:MAG: D-alanyl-D-alanine carboxypeptidase (penicillin-binding protein 5/6) [Syntrophaceae bacterium]